MNSCLGTCSIQLSYADVDGKPRQVTVGPVACAYTNQVEGAIPVPDGSASGTEFDIPLPELLSGASLLVVENNTGQELNAAWGGNWAPHIAAGGVLMLAMPAPPSAGPVTGLRFMLTQPQVGTGKIAFHAFGQ